MSKHRKKIGNPTQPKNNVTVGNVVLSDLIYIDLTKYPHWTDTIHLDDFTNCLQNQEQALRHFSLLLIN